MAKAKTQFGNKSKDAVQQLVATSRDARKNSYKFFSIIILDLYIRLGSHSDRETGFFGEHKNSISDSAKQSILTYVAENGYEVKASSETTVRKCWGKIKDASKDHGITSVIDGSDHKSIDAKALLGLIESDEVIINIVNNGQPIVVKGRDSTVKWRPNQTQGKAGVMYNATRNLDGTVVIKKKRDGTLSTYTVKVIKPEECTSVSDVLECRKHWKSVIEKAEAELAVLKPMARKDKFKACNR